jgi:hypothetical protein
MHLCRTKYICGIILLAGLSSTLSLPTSCAGGQAVYVGANIAEQHRVQLGRIDHRAWTLLLNEYVDDNGMVNYAAWQRSAADQQLLDKYLQQLSFADVSESSDRNTRLAYWINAYNAVTVKGILREYPTSSIRNHTPRIYGYHIWKDLKLIVDGHAYSLEEIEHVVLRRMGEPRIHFALVCASKGCPRLLNKAYEAKHLEEQLRENAEHFFGDRSKLQFDSARGIVHVSPILEWFAEDFGATPTERLRAIAPYVPADATRHIAGGSIQVRYLEYDWDLNEQAPTRK